METNHKFKCKDEVIYRSIVEYGNPIWTYGIFSHYEENNDITYAVIAGSNGHDITKWDILPYEGNEHLVGTTDEPDEEVKLEKGECVIGFDNVKAFLNKQCFVCFGLFKGLEGFSNGPFKIDEILPKYCVRFSDFDPNDMKETKKHILCVKNGKVIKYKG